MTNEHEAEIQSASQVHSPPAPAPVADLSAPEQQWRLMERQALGLSKAVNAIPKAYAGKPGDILAAFIYADELGIGRMAMLRGGYVVNGKVSLSGDLLMAVALANGCQVVETIEEGEKENDLAATCTVKTREGHETSATFTVADAIQAGLWGGSDVWKKFPKQMLKMRARGFALRSAIPDKLAGVYAPGEIIDVTPEPGA